MTETPVQRRTLAWRELAVRIASALVLASATLALTASGSDLFALLAAAVAAAMIWEWGRLVRGANLDVATWVGLAGIGLAIGLAATDRSWGAALVIGMTAAATFFVTDPAARLASAFGPLYAGLPALTLILLHRSAPAGALAVIFLLLVVWSTDTGAFIAGRAIGGPKLWVAISPNKTWSGLLGGTLFGVLIALAYATWVASPVPARVALLAAVLAVISQLGDLCESALKRAYGVKDTSHLIPGHGGFMDRLDSLVFAAVAAGLWCLVNQPSPPATALLGLH